MKSNTFLVFFGLLLLANCKTTKNNISSTGNFFALNKPEEIIKMDLPVQEYKSFDNEKIAYYKFSPLEKPIAKLLFIHGGGANSNLGYFNLAQTLKDEYFVETYLLDIRGHGMSGGRRGDCPSEESLYKDINEMLQIATKDKTNLPIYLGGHSSGGGLVLNYNSWSEKKEVDGYFFIAPEFGYKSNTKKKDAIPFADIEVKKFIKNAMSNGVKYQNDYAVHFNYPKKVVLNEPSIVTSITVNMAKALTPSDPKEQFRNIKKPFALFIGDNDELFDSEKLIEYASLPSLKNEKSVSKTLEKTTHLSILINIGTEIGSTIKEWNL